MGSTGHEEDAKEHASQSRAEARIVVPAAAPFGEAVLEEVVVAFAARPAENLGNQAEARKTLRGLDTLGVDLRAGEALVFGRLELVGVEAGRGLAVGLVDVVKGGGGAVLDADKVWGNQLVAGGWERGCGVCIP